MKAVTFQGAGKVEVEQVDDPKIENPDNIIVRVTLRERFDEPMATTRILMGMAEDISDIPGHSAGMPGARPSTCGFLSRIRRPFACRTIVNWMMTNWC